MKNYIRGVDGLRAIAVLAVVVFHACPTLLRGGFIGVDVFFVISGFIITKTYFDDLQSNRKSLRQFFVKRVRRLAPIYLVVLFVTTVASCLILTPIHLRHFGESLVAQPVYLQNVVFWHHGDYFEKALSKPLLHTWSLAVEEQFYLSYALLILIVRRRRGLAMPLLVAAVAGSIALAYVLSTVSPKTAFYWLPTRVWQMALGVIAARLTSSASRTTWSWALLPGLGLVIWAIVGFDEHARFPGVQSVAACAGTALGLLSVSTSDSKLASGLLANPGMVHVGKLSYSLYLWHWPIIALAATYLDRGLRLGEAGAAVVATFLVSQLGYTYLETPVRTGRLVTRDRTLLSIAASAAAVTVAIAVLLVRTDGATFRYPPEIARLYVAQQQRSPYRCPSAGRLIAPSSEMCKINEVEASTNILVLGDSHADVLDEMIAEVARSQGMGAFLTKRDCKLYDFGARVDCSDGVLSQIRKDIDANRIKYVLSMAFTTKDFDGERRLGDNAAKLLESVDGLFLMQVVPNDAFFDPAERARLLRRNSPLPRPYTLQSYARDNQPAFDSLRRLAASNAKIKVLDPSHLLCPRDDCDFDTNGVPNYFDAHHLSPTGAQRLAPMFADVLRSLPRHETVQTGP